MYLPRDLVSHLYSQLCKSWHAQSPPVLLLVALEPDALCACRVLTTLLKRDYIAHNIIPVSGYGDLARVGEEQVQPMRTQNGGSGGTVICLGVGGLVDLGAVLGMDPVEEDEDGTGGVELWVVDARRPWNLGNVFGGKPPDKALGELNGNARARKPEVSLGQVQQHYHSGKGGIIVFDDGDIAEELQAEREAFFELDQLPPIDDDGQESDESESASESDGSGDEKPTSRKRKSWSDADEDSGDEEGRPRQRRRSNSQESIEISEERPARHGLLSTAIPNSFPSRSSSPTNPPPSYQVKQLSLRRKRRRLLRIKRKHEATLHAYYSTGTSYSEPISALLYSLASDLGREDNNSLWYAIVGVSSLELYGRSTAGVGLAPAASSTPSRSEQICQVLREEVRRLNPPDPSDAHSEASRGGASGVIPTTARSPTDNSIRLSPEPRFLLIRHWSLYDSMLHSPYLASRLRLWNDAGQKRLHKLLAKMGISLSQCRQNYTHMDMDLKKSLRARLLRNASLYDLEGLVPPDAQTGGGPRAREGWGFVRSWGWKACLSAVDVGVIVGAILEVGKGGAHLSTNGNGNGTNSHGSSASQEQVPELVDEEGRREGEEYVGRFWDAYDALENVSSLLSSLPSTQHLHRAILRTGTALLSKQQIRHLRAFRMAVVREGPDVQLFTHPGALTKLALWVAEALAEKDKDGSGKSATPLVLAGLNEARGVYVVVGTGGGGGGKSGGSGVGGARGVDEEVKKREREERKVERTRKREERKVEKERRKAQRKEKKMKKRKATATSDDEDDDDDDDNDDEDEDDDEDDTESESESDSESDSDSASATHGSGGDGDDPTESAISALARARERGRGKNRFGNSFQEVVEETGARVRIDSFEHCVVEVKKDDLPNFLEALSAKAVVG